MPSKTPEKQKHLGKGLEALLGPIGSPKPNSKNRLPTSDNQLETFIDKTMESGPRELQIADIIANPFQSRTYFDDNKLDELAASIKANGIIQPIVVRRVGTGYEIIAGERRFRASKMIGKDTIPAIIREASDEEMLEWALVENIHRADLNPIERAKDYESYMSTFGLTQTEAAERLGEDRSVVCNYLRLLQLPKEVCTMLTDGQLSMGHARAILSLPTDDLKRKLANRALAGRLSVREVERLVKQYLQEDSKEIVKKHKSPHILELEGKLSTRFGSRVKIDTRKGGQKGKITIEFKSINDFDFILEKLGIDYQNDF